MARAVRDKKLDSKAARAELPVRASPVTAPSRRGCTSASERASAEASGYCGATLAASATRSRRSRRGRRSPGRRRHRCPHFRPGGRSGEKRAGHAVEQARLANFGAPITVSTAIDQYLTQREKRESFGNKRNSRSRLTRHVGNELAEKDLAALTDEDLRDWRSQLTAKAAHRRNGASLSETTIRRTVGDMKAALNAAAVRYRKRLPATIAGEIRNGLKNPKGYPQWRARRRCFPKRTFGRSLMQLVASIRSGDGAGSERLVVMLAATGARLSQVARLTVGDVRLEHLQVMMPTSRKGSVEKDMPHTRVRIGADVAAILKPSVARRKGSEPLLLRPRWRPTTGWRKWEIYDRGPWRAANELARPWAAIIAKAGLSKAVVPYALRHSSIVRGLKAGLPVRLVAAMHDTSSTMIERHYSVYITDAMDELMAKAIVPLVTAPAARRRAAG